MSQKKILILHCIHTIKETQILCTLDININFICTCHIYLFIKVSIYEFKKWQKAVTLFKLVLILTTKSSHFFLMVITCRNRPGIPIPFRVWSFLRSETKFRSVFRLVRTIHIRFLNRSRVFCTVPILCSEFRNQANSELDSELKIHSF